MDPLAAIDRVLDTMQPISLEKMKAVRLMNRMDQKYLTSMQRLPELLDRIKGSYYVQRIDGEALADYRTLYFDTANLEMYTDHHNRKLNRQKIRVRCYRNSMTTFFEIKDKDNRKKTKKTRLPIDATLFENPFADGNVSQFLREKSHYNTTDLMQQVENRFRRITLVDTGFNERVTIDYGITFVNRHTSLQFDLSRLVILEVKHETGAPLSHMEQALKEMRIQPRRVSKYCIGTVLTNPYARYNRFKEKIRIINALTDGQCEGQIHNSHLTL